MRRNRKRTCLCVYSTFCLMLVAAPTMGQQDELSVAPETASREVAPPLATSAMTWDRSAVLAACWAASPIHVEPAAVQFELGQVAVRKLAPAAKKTPHRSAALIPLYSSFAALQALDVHSTWQAVDRGSREANPLVAPMVGMYRFPVVKFATTAGIILATEQLRKSHPRAAVVVMIAANSAYAMIVTNNYALAMRD